MIKKIIRTAAAAVFMTAAAAGIVYGDTYIGSETRFGIVSDIGPDYLEFAFDDGNIYTVDDTAGLSIGQPVNVLFSVKSNDRRDDIIISFKAIDQDY